MTFVAHSTDFVDIGGKPIIKQVWEKEVQFQLVSLINGLMKLIYSVNIRKSHKRIDLNMEGILVELLLLQ